MNLRRPEENLKCQGGNNILTHANIIGGITQYRFPPYLLQQNEQKDRQSVTHTHTDHNPVYKLGEAKQKDQDKG